MNKTYLKDSEEDKTHLMEETSRTTQNWLWSVGWDNTSNKKQFSLQICSIWTQAFSSALHIHNLLQSNKQTLRHKQKSWELILDQ